MRGLMHVHEEVAGIGQARVRVDLLLRAGYRKITAEVIDGDGNVIASYDRDGWQVSNV